jgi:hypothetical protein
MKSAVILRLQRRSPYSGDLRTWYEYAPLVRGRPRRKPDHMMSTPETAADRARRDGYMPEMDVIDY